MNLSIKTAFLSASAVAFSLASSLAGAQATEAGGERKAAPTTQSAAPAVTGNAAPAGPHGHGHPGGAHHGPRGDGDDRMFKRMDTDGDGKVSRAEFDAAQKAMVERAQKAFETADANRDGALSADEQRAFRDAMHAQMRPPR